MADGPSSSGDQEANSGNQKFLYFTTLIVNLIAFSVGSAFSWTSPVLPKLEEDDGETNPIERPITATEESWIAALLYLGAALGPLICGFPIRKFGRKETLLVVACPIIISYTMTAFTTIVPLYYLARLLMGLSVGSVYAALPLYITEIGQDHNRGTLGCIMSVFVAGGLLFSYAVGPYVPIKEFCLICLIPPLIFLPFFLICIPESPHYYAFIRDERRLQGSLMKLRQRTREDVRKEMIQIIENTEKSIQNQGHQVKDLCKTKASRKGLIITITLVTLQQFSGINAVFSYMQQIFNATGSEIPPEIASIIVGVVQLFAVIVTSCLVDKIGRKILLMISLVGCCTALVALSIYFGLQESNFDIHVIFWLPILSLMIYIISFNFGLGPLPWTVMAELFPSNIKSTTSTMTAVICFLMSFVVTLLFPIVSPIVGMASCFCFFAGICAVGAVFIFFTMPEVKGKTIVEIQELLEGK